MALTKALGGGSGSSLTVKDEGSTLSTAVTSIDVVGAGATATNTGGAVTLTVPGSAGAGALLASYWSNTTLTVNPDLAADTIVTGYSVTFSVAGSTNVLIRVSCRAAKSGAVVLSLYEGATKLAPLSAGGSAPPPAGWYLDSGNGGERSNLQGTFEMGYTFAAGSHTIDVYHAASANLNSLSFFERTLAITQL